MSCISSRALTMLSCTKYVVSFKRKRHKKSVYFQLNP
jgi:hypothetical protein